MDIANEHVPSLIDHPQRLGVLPTWWFWTGERWRLARPPVALAALLLVMVIGSLGLPIVVTALLPALLFTLGLGLFERYIRRRALTRRLEHTAPTRQASDGRTRP